MIKKSIRNKDRGFVLIAVLVVISVLVTVIVEFNYESRLQLHLSDNSRNAARALHYAEAGVSMAIASLKKNADTLYRERFNNLFNGSAEVSVGNGYCTILVEDESGKININKLKTSDGAIHRRRIDQALKLIDLLNYQYKDESVIGYGLIPAIIDWVDYDDEVTVLPFIKKENKGAENSYYKRLVDGYRCKNASFETVDELLLVKGMTPEVFYGRAGEAGRNTEPVEELARYLTIYGDGKININEASPQVIMSLSDRIGGVLAQRVVEQRQIQRFATTEQLKNIPGMTPQIYEAIHELITVKSEEHYYNITATGVAGQFVRKVQLVVRKKGDSAQIEKILRKEL
jgi:general secretion pathway protein K